MPERRGNPVGLKQHFGLCHFFETTFCTIFLSPTFFFSFAFCANKRETRSATHIYCQTKIEDSLQWKCLWHAKKKRKSRACLELVSYFETQIYRHKTESKFAFQNTTSSMSILSGKENGANPKSCTKTTTFKHNVIYGCIGSHNQYYGKNFDIAIRQVGFIFEKTNFVTYYLFIFLVFCS